MARSKSPIMLVLIASSIACILLMALAYNFLNSVLSYDAKEAAIERVQQCLNAEPDTQQQACDLIINYPCWNAIEDSRNNPYSIEVLWYNWEDHISSRGGDEVYLEVTFSNGSVFYILWYEGVLESCEEVVLDD